jgi:hypothetical protein
LPSIIFALEHQQAGNNGRALIYYFLLILFFTVAEGACIDFLLPPCITGCPG